MGKRVGRFKLVGLLGQGAMGRVFRAEDALLHRHVALKVLSRNHQRGSRTVAAERLIREARAAASLEHPHIASIYEMNHAGGITTSPWAGEGGRRELIGRRADGAGCFSRLQAPRRCGRDPSQGVIPATSSPLTCCPRKGGARCGFGLARVEERADVIGVATRSARAVRRAGNRVGRPRRRVHFKAWPELCYLLTAAAFPRAEHEDL